MTAFEFDCAKETVDRLRELVKEQGEKFGCVDAFKQKADLSLRPREVSRRIIASKDIDAPLLKAEFETSRDTLKWSKKIAYDFMNFARKCWFCVHEMHKTDKYPAATHFNCVDFMKEKNYECDDAQRLLEEHILKHGLDIREEPLLCETPENVRPSRVKYIVECVCQFNDFGMNLIEAQRLCKQEELTNEEMGCVSRAIFLDKDTTRLVCVWPNSEIGHAYQESNEQHIFDPPKVQQLLAGKSYDELF